MISQKYQTAAFKHSRAREHRRYTAGQLNKLVILTKQVNVTKILVKRIGSVDFLSHIAYGCIR